MPGVLRLEAELGVNRKTVETALRRLEMEGMLISQGPGRRRLICQMNGAKRASLRVAMLIAEPADRGVGYLIGMRHKLIEAGHHIVDPPKTMTELGMDVGRIMRMVGKTEADAWLVAAGSHEVLESFVARGAPTFALFGRRRGFPIAGVGPDKPSAIAVATKTLIGLGHRRIVMLVRRLHRIPIPGASEQAFLNELAIHGIPPSPSYHLPDWEFTVDGFHGCLESLFKITPPTALIIDEMPFYVAAREFLAKHGLRIPADVSLVSTDADPAFAWCKPSVSHIRWNHDPVVRRVVRWAGNVSAGKQDLRQSSTPAEFVVGGTIGPARHG